MYSNEIGTSKPIAFRRQRHLSMKVSERSCCNGKCSKHLRNCADGRCACIDASVLAVLLDLFCRLNVQYARRWRSGREERRGQGLYVLYMEALTPSDAAHFRECSWLVQWELTLAALV